MAMTTSAAGRAKITEREGNKLVAYLDSVGVWTIGVGHTAAAGEPVPKKGMKITAALSDAILGRDLATFETAVNRAVKVALTQNQFDALVSLAFNIGGGAFAKSTLVKHLNRGDIDSAADAFRLWNKGTVAGKRVVIAGLTKRREQERAQFLTMLIPPARPPLLTPVVTKALPAGAGDGFGPGFSTARQEAQQSLADAGYSMVGLADGLAGARTTAALTAFQQTNGLPVTAKFDEDTIATLGGEPKKLPVSYTRANATPKDVAKMDTTAGSIVRHANKILAGAGGTALSLPGITALIEPLQQVREFFASVPPIVWAMAVSAVLAFVIWQVWSIRAKSVGAHRIAETA